MDTRYGLVLKSFSLGGLISYYVPAPFGRFSIKSRLSLPGRAGWVCQEVVGPLCLLYKLRTWPAMAWTGQLAAAMFLLHYLNRSLIFPLCIQPSYGDTHVLVVAGAMLWQVCNGHVQAVAMHEAVDASRMRTTVALLLYVLGLAGNVYHDLILARLRHKQGSKTKYSVPHGGLFALVSYPHYLLEWIEWTGYALLLGSAGGYAGLWFVLLEVSVMLPRALRGHAWYASTFKSSSSSSSSPLVLPATRRAIIPYLL